ncbi:MAG: hypothetical protein EON54_08190 [Alcaligenaceae bacterium]|nr:MAG: hypothetical protein EON54_08190 [Alcaligenaceae bacterium]
MLRLGMFFLFFGVAKFGMAFEVAPEIAQVPGNITLVSGPQAAVLDVGLCKIKMRLMVHEYFWTSSAYGDTVFYAPGEKLIKKKAPYLYKPDVQIYSGAFWNYVKPKPLNEPWFGIMCMSNEKNDAPSIDSETNCPAQKISSSWVLKEIFSQIYRDPQVISITGKNWDGFFVSFKNKSASQKNLREVRFCAFGKNKLIMGQTAISEDKNSQQKIIRAIERLEFLN